MQSPHHPLLRAEGLIAPQPRDGNNYRSYAPTVVEELSFIRSAKEIGFSLAEIRAVLEARRSSSLDCLQGAELVDAKITEIRGHLARLRQTKLALEAMRAELVASALHQGLAVPTRLARHGSAAPGTR
ncbi:hypothetical protein IDVR_20410 [Intrasporangium sp. DVR]